MEKILEINYEMMYSGRTLAERIFKIRDDWVSRMYFDRQSHSQYYDTDVYLYKEILEDKQEIKKWLDGPTKFKILFKEHGLSL